MSRLKHFVGKMLPVEFKQFVRREYRSIRFRKEMLEAYDHYSQVEKLIKARNKKRLCVAAYVVFDSSFAAYDLFDLLISQPEKYEAKIIIIPDIIRGPEHQAEQYDKTKDFFIRRYGKSYVFDGWIKETDEYKDYSEEIDVVYLANPYDDMVHEKHGINYLSKKNVLPFYVSYGCMPDNYGCRNIMPMKEISLFWKVFADNEMSFKDYKKYELAKGRNVILSGYAKMDSLAKANKVEYDKDRKTITIAPHHTVNYPELPLSNFLEYSEFFLDLPAKFPQINFVFRPHPLLFTNMVNEGYWTQEQVNEYLEKVRKTGMVYSAGGDYFDIFASSDAMIHDCSSFVVEYLFTGKPCCFMAKKNYRKVFSNLGKKCLENYYLAFNAEQIESFIKDIVNDKKDEMKERRESFSKNKLMINYPDATKKVLDEIASFRDGE